MDSRVSKPAALPALRLTGGTAPACIQCSSGSSLKMAPRSQGMPGAPASLRNTQKKNITGHTKSGEIFRMLSQPSITCYLSHADSGDAVKARKQSHTCIVYF